MKRNFTGMPEFREERGIHLRVCFIGRYQSVNELCLGNFALQLGVPKDVIAPIADEEEGLP